MTFFLDLFNNNKTKTKKCFKIPTQIPKFVYINNPSYNRNNAKVPTCTKAT